MIHTTDWAIEISELSKKFELQKPRSIFELHKKRKAKTFWALKDINLKIQHGKCVGIIGPNGAGKSTLLKILSKILKPTSGVIKINGRVNSLLEVGTGFEKELSGRKNIFLNSSILGMSNKETEEIYNDIVDFSGVEEFIDVPVKYYSSGMYSRLAFSIAAYSKSEILLIDEVLSVGDISFREKSLNKMTDLMFSETKTVIFVSHGLSSISKLCDQVVWLEKGQILDIGEPNNIIEKYKEKSTTSNSPRLKKNIDEDILIGNQFDNNISSSLKLLEIKVVNGNKKEKKILAREDTLKIYIKIENQINMPMQCSFHLFCKPRSGIEELTHVFTSHSPIFKETGTKNMYVEIPSNFLITGKYQVDIGFGSTSGGKKPLIRHLKVENANSFEIIETKKSIIKHDLDKVRGVIHPKLNWSFMD